jgi:hypothetical protein
LANKAKHPDVWKRLEQLNNIAGHWPHPDVVKCAIEKLRAHGESGAIERIESFHVPERAEIHDIIGYDR